MALARVKTYWAKMKATDIAAKSPPKGEDHHTLEHYFEDVLVRLWLAEPIPDSYFGLVRRLADAVPRIDVVKLSACIEGARKAFARVNTYWAKMKATDIAAKSPPKGKDHHMPEHYFEDVLEGARLIEGQFSKDMIFE